MKMKIRDIEKEYGIKMDARKNMNTSTWLRKKGLSNIAKALDLIEQKKPNSKLT